MRKSLPGIGHWQEFDKINTTLEVNYTVKVLASIRGVTYRRIEETETKGIFHLRFSVKGYGDFFLMYSDCDEDFAKKAKKSWSCILSYVASHPNIRWVDIEFTPTNSIIKTVISHLSKK